MGRKKQAWKMVETQAAVENQEAGSTEMIFSIIIWPGQKDTEHGKVAAGLLPTRGHCPQKDRDAIAWINLK